MKPGPKPGTVPHAKTMVHKISIMCCMGLLFSLVPSGLKFVMHKTLLYMHENKKQPHVFDPLSLQTAVEIRLGF